MFYPVIREHVMFVKQNCIVQWQRKVQKSNTYLINKVISFYRIIHLFRRCFLCLCEGLAEVAGQTSHQFPPNDEIPVLTMKAA